MAKLIDDALLYRANYRCEYCLKRIIGSRYEIEHIRPKVRGGSDSLDNLAIACRHCNGNKLGKVTARDPVTWQDWTLFNPRTDIWDEHFGLSDSYTVGITPVGRATATLLFRITPQYLAPQLEWWPIDEIRDESLRLYLHHQRNRRLSNQFLTLQEALSNLQLSRKISPKDRERANIAIRLLQGELLYTRSKPSDVMEGIQLLEDALSLPRISEKLQIEIFSILSILYQQFATLWALDKNQYQSSKWQAKAAKVYHNILRIAPKVELSDEMRLLSVKRKYDVSSKLLFKKNAIKLAIAEANSGKLKALTYLADAQICSPNRSSSLERILEATEKTLSRCGYGQNFDYARSVVLRRRWWGLKVLAKERCNLDLLEKDLEFWGLIGMKNEFRELKLLLQRIAERIGTEQINDMIHTMESFLQVSSSLGRE